MRLDESQTDDNKNKECKRQHCLVAMRAIYGLFLAWQAVSALQMRPTSALSLAQCVRKAAIPVARRGRGLFVASITVGDQSK